MPAIDDAAHRGAPLWVPPGMVRGRGGRWRAARCRCSAGRCLRRQVERQERHQPLQPVVHHQRRRVGQDVLHRLEIHAPQRHVLRRLIGRQHRKEALRLPGRLRDRGQPGALPFRHDARRIAAGARHDVVAIGLRLVAQAFGVGVGALHVEEAFHHLGRRIDLLQLHLGDLDARPCSCRGSAASGAARRSRSARAVRSAPAGSACGRSPRASSSPPPP